MWQNIAATCLSSLIIFSILPQYVKRLRAANLYLQRPQPEHRGKIEVPERGKDDIVFAAPAACVCCFGSFGNIVEVIMKMPILSIQPVRLR